MLQVPHLQYGSYFPSGPTAMLTPYLHRLHARWSYMGGRRGAMQGQLSCSLVMHDGIAVLQVTLEDFGAAQTRVRPSAMREVALELPRVRWGDVGGLDAIKQRLREAVEWPQKHPELLKRLGAKVFNLVQH